MSRILSPVAKPERITFSFVHPHTRCSHFIPAYFHPSINPYNFFTTIHVLLSVLSSQPGPASLCNLSCFPPFSQVTIFIFSLTNSICFLPVSHSHPIRYLSIFVSLKIIVSTTVAFNVLSLRCETSYYIYFEYNESLTNHVHAGSQYNSLISFLLRLRNYFNSNIPLLAIPDITTT